MNRKWVVAVGTIALVGSAILLSGCEEGNVGLFSRNNVSASKVETYDLSVEQPLVLDVGTSNGAVSVRGVAGLQTASVTATLRSRGSTLEEAEDRVDRIVHHVWSTGGRINLRYTASEQDSDVRRYSGVEFDVVVPADLRVEVDTSNGAVSVENVHGTIFLDTSNGAITVARSSGPLVADTSNGRIEVLSFTGELRLDTSNGSVHVEDFAGSIDAETSNGSVTYDGTPFAGDHRLRTSNGSVTVRVPRDASVAFEASTSSGRIESGLPLVGDTHGDDWSATLNAPADVTFSLRTSNGTIRLEGTP